MLADDGVMSVNIDKIWALALADTCLPRTKSDSAGLRRTSASVRQVKVRGGHSLAFLSAADSTGLRRTSLLSGGLSA